LKSDKNDNLTYVRITCIIELLRKVCVCSKLPYLQFFIMPLTYKGIRNIFLPFFSIVYKYDYERSSGFNLSLCLVYHQPKQNSIRTQIDVNKYLSPSVYVTRHGNKIFGVSDVIRVDELTRAPIILIGSQVVRKALHFQVTSYLALVTVFYPHRSNHMTNQDFVSDGMQVAQLSACIWKHKLCSLFKITAFV